MDERKNKPYYRPDIDGLRALAVLSVITFHIKESLLPGGFIGVDVFFVISGYLITYNIATELQAGKFSILDFYRRRIKRIAPAMIVVVTTVMLMAQVLTIPEDAERTAESAIWSLASLGNVYFWLFQDQSYFAQDARELPLLHLWSLGVEEQFYLIWPLAAIVLIPRTRSKPLVVGLGCAAILSYLLGQIVFPWSPSFVYYMLPSRAGELLVGAILGIMVAHNIQFVPSRAQARVIGYSGLALVVGSLFFLSDGDVFPGLRAIPPTLGTAMLIMAGQVGCRVSKVLSSAPLVWIGLVSYSAYLWHWPLLAFLRYGFGDVSPAAAIVVFALTFLLAALSYRFVEQPARRVRWGFRKVFTGQLLIPAGIVGASCLFIMYTDGMKLRPNSVSFEHMRPAYTYDYVCQRWRITKALAKSPECTLGEGVTKSTNILLWGDSNAAHYVGVIGAFAKEAGFSFRNIEHSACPPLLTDPLSYISARRRRDCLASLDVARALVEEADVVLMSASWPAYQHQDPSFLADVFKTVEILVRNGKQVILIGKAPTFEDYDRQCLQKAKIYPFIKCDRQPVPIENSVTELNSELQKFASQTDDVWYFDITKVICEKNLCSPLNGQGMPLYYDSDHLSMKGSWYIGKKYVDQFGIPPAFEFLNRGVLFSKLNRINE